MKLYCHIHVTRPSINVGSQGEYMIKLISFFIFVAAFVWTWTLMTSKNTIGVEVHAGIQSKLAILIQDSIKAKRPNSSHFQLNQIYTEKMDDNKIKAHFSYKFTDMLEDQEKTEQIISGEALLSRSLSEDPLIQKWVIQSVKTNANALEFKEGTVISADGKAAVESAPVATPVDSTEKMSK